MTSLATPWSSFLTIKKKTDPKTAQRMLRQSHPSLTLRRYTQTDMDELFAAQAMGLEAIFCLQDNRKDCANAQRDSEEVNAAALALESNALLVVDRTEMERTTRPCL